MQGRHDRRGSHPHYVLSPGRYVGSEAEEDDGVLLEEKVKALRAELVRQFAEGARLEKRIRENLEGLGLGCESGRGKLLVKTP